MVRALVTGALFRSQVPDVSHLASYSETDALGPLQRDEALLLYGTLRALRPQTVVEIGFCQGRSAFNFLRALDPSARLYSFDIDPQSAALADDLFGHDPRFRFTLRSQDSITASDIDERVIEFLLIDASHELGLNQRTFTALEPLFASRAIVAIHDTGTWPREHLPVFHAEHASGEPDHWLGDEYEHQPDERAFVNWIADAYPSFGQIHFHSTRTLRHGLTMLQAGGPLPTTG